MKQWLLHVAVAVVASWVTLALDIALRESGLDESAQFGLTVAAGPVS